ncbi:pyruvoyl-dependent arginine decarboxylase [Nocardioides sp. CFH 31398]|uniref:pyruvoyl-dependent arginine decarboxylase n=1 Tax=Nocardioides sp. CFH 31398 TaxID=2919579 RepID=UPI001F06994C|nr:pyruvoyl-dependent arginine decarboxylase [Nocardioides sp. CFH 31398]MCH1865970.1 pyruvoyl-dependent arginine decarboxylase [Nocardioides sp. CFH 31398]
MSPDRPSGAHTRAATGIATGRISVRAARGSGRTPLSAFDDALHQAGVSNVNLLVLSSVVPPGVAVEVDDAPPPLDAGHGDRLYCVLSVAHAELRGQTAWAGLGWVNDPDRGGLFVEHHGGAEESVRELIDLTLADMAERRGTTYSETEACVIDAHCDDRPVCALVVATYDVARWDS